MNDIDFIGGSQAVVRQMGGWPSFHDARILRIAFDPPQLAITFEVYGAAAGAHQGRLFRMTLVWENLKTLHLDVSQIDIIQSAFELDSVNGLVRSEFVMGDTGERLKVLSEGVHVAEVVEIPGFRPESGIEKISLDWSFSTVTRIGDPQGL